MNRKFFHASLCVLAPLPAALLAQEIPVGAAPDSGSAFNNKVYRVEVTKPRTDADLRRAAPVPRQVYGRPVLEKYGDSNMADVLRRLPGVEVQDGSVRLRGLGASYAQVLINGEPAPEGFTVDQINPAQVERVEVSKAPTADQSAQAVAGNLNIILRTAARRRRQLDLRAGTSYSEHHPVRNVSLTYGDSLGSLDYSVPLSGYDWRAAESLTIDRRVQRADGTAALAFQNGTRPMWGHELNASPQLTWRPSEAERVTAQAFVQDGRWASRVLFQNRPDSAAELVEAPSSNGGAFKYQRLSVNWNRRLSQAQKFDVRVTHGRAANSFSNLTFQGGLPFRLSQGDSRDRTTTAAGKFSQLAGAHHIVALGAELERRTRIDDRTVLVLGREQLPGIDGQPFDARIDRTALYVQDEWTPVEQWLVYAGVRQERIGTRSGSGGGQVDNVSKVLAPLVHLTWTPDPKKDDSVRLSLARTYKAPDLYGLVARPSLASLYPFPDQPNSALATDKAGNPALRPELATGLDVAYEHALPHNGSLRLGVFHRRVQDLIRYVTTLEHVDYATVPRWVTRPQNFSRASSDGLELEAAARVGDLAPWLLDPRHDLTLSGALNVYRSKVDAVPMPNNRLDGQQPWSAVISLDYAASSVPVTWGANLSFTPGFLTQETIEQATDRSRTRNLDLYGHWRVTPSVGVRFGATNVAPVSGARTTTNGNSWLQVVRKPGATYSLTLEVKL